MCGVIGVVGTPDAAKETFLGLITLQHRGQDAAGILSLEFEHSDSKFHQIKDIGLVEKVFGASQIEILKGQYAVGHTRYSTVGKGELSEVQPMLCNYPYGIGIVHNGNVVNYLEVKECLQSEMRVKCLTNSDTETILNWISQNLQGVSFNHIFKAVSSVFENIRGSYSVVGLIADAGMIAFRDPNGIRPLMLGEKIFESGKKAYMVASETSPLSFLGYKLVRNLLPGEVIFIDSNGELHSQVYSSVKPATARRPCMFEWVYFASAESEIEYAPVYGVRLSLGRSLAKLIKSRMEEGEISADLVTPVPDTARPSALAIAEELKIVYRDILIKNRYINRTFILGTQSKREKAVDLKLHPIFSEIKGKNVLLVDDSIVRGTTSRKLVQLVRNAGANKVYFVSTCPPVVNPCYYGIDFPDANELIAAKNKSDSLRELEKKVALDIGADAVIYQTIEGLQNSIHTMSQGRVTNPCMACINGQYPTNISEAKRFTELRRKERST